MVTTIWPFIALLITASLIQIRIAEVSTVITTSADIRFYIYDWPHMIDRYANYSDRPHHGHGVEFPQWRQHFGAGRLLDSEQHEHKTSQFALFKLIYERALLDPRRTLDPVTATSFLIPYDFGMDACFFEAHGRMRRTQCPLATEAIRLLRNSTYFQRNRGHDHSLIVSVNQNMNYFFGAPMCTSFLHYCWNCTKLSIDEYMFIAKDRRFELKNRGINWHAVPFPSDYHFDANATSLPPWLRETAAGTSTTAATTAIGGDGEWESRQQPISFVGNTRKFSEVNTQLRIALVEQCQNHSDYCSTVQYQHDASKQRSPNAVSRNSTFCLQPPGDMPTRKSVFDAVLSGCIPVLFHPMTARFMYEWHLGQSGWDDIAVHFDTVQENEALVNQRLDVVQRLIEMYQQNQSLIQWKQQRIRQLAHQLQFSKIFLNETTQQKVVSALSIQEATKRVKLSDKVNSSILFTAATTPEEIRNNDGFVSGSSSSSSTELSVESPVLMLADAYDATMDHVLRIHAGRISHDRISDYLSCLVIKRRDQTSDYCSTTHNSLDPYQPPALRSPLYQPQ